MTTTNPTSPCRWRRRRFAKALLVVVAAMCLVAGSLTAQTLDSQLASRLTAADASRPAACLTKCPLRKPTPRRVIGGWPKPYLPALLVLTSLALFYAAARVPATRPHGVPIPASTASHATAFNQKTAKDTR